VKLKKLLSTPRFWLVLTLIFIIPSFWALLKPGYFNMHDDLQMMRQLQLEKCFQDAQFPCRWVPDMGYGYGYPLFNFYPPLPYYLGQIFRVLGFSFVVTAKLTFVLQFLLAALFMYLLAAAVFGPLAGFISALFYTFAPYHALDVYVRGAMNEAWALAFFPLIFYAAYRLIKEEKSQFLVLLSLSFSALLLSHNVMALIFTPLLLSWVIFWLIVNKKITIHLPKRPSLLTFFQNLNWPLFLKFLISGGLALGLAAFFTLPLLLEVKQVQLESMFAGYYNYIVHFTSLRQLFISRFWGFGASTWGQEDQMSFQIGWLHWALPLLISFLILFPALIKKKIKKLNHLKVLTLILTAAGLWAAFLTHERSALVWRLLPFLQKAQFPWRFLSLAIFAFSFAISGLVELFPVSSIKKTTHQISPRLLFLLPLLLFGLFSLNLNYFQPEHQGPLTDEEKFSGRAWVLQQTGGIYDYLPIWARLAPRDQAKPVVDAVWEGEAEITNKQQGSNWLSFEAEVSSPSAKIVLSQFYFPDFKIFDAGQEIDFDIEPELGRMLVNLPAGSHQIEARLYNTPIRTVANLISLFSWLGLSFYFFKKMKNGFRSS